MSSLDKTPLSKEVEPLKPLNNESYLSHLLPNLKTENLVSLEPEELLRPSNIDELSARLKEDLGIDLLKYSRDAQRGLITFLSRMKGFSSRTLSDLASRSPIYSGFAMSIPLEDRDKLNFIQAWFHDPNMRDSLVRSCALFLDEPDQLASLVSGRLNANYYGELIKRNLGDEGIKLIAELADSEQQLESEFRGSSSLFEIPSTDGSIVSASIKRLRKEATQIVQQVFGPELRQALEYDPDGYNVSLLLCLNR